MQSRTLTAMTLLHILLAMASCWRKPTHHQPLAEGDIKRIGWSFMTGVGNTNRARWLDRTWDILLISILNHWTRCSTVCSYLFGCLQTTLDTYTFKAFIDFPEAMASHSPGVECPVFIVIPAICGDHAKLVISRGAVYAITGSETIRFFTSGRGEFNRDPALRGDAAACV
jgi:hypothetical protein